MIKNHLFSLVIVGAFHLGLTAQTSIESILTSIAQNNKTILANRQFWESQSLQYKTGLTLANPNVNFDYMIGSPISAGNQTDISIAQSFDFPTAYAKRSQLSAQKIAQIEFQNTLIRQEVLLEAKQECIELVYRYKLQNELYRRKLILDQLLTNFQIQLYKGDGSIIDVNKAQLQLIEINKKIRLNNSEVTQIKQQLTELNGGNTVEFNDTTYSLSLTLPSFEVLEAEIEYKDPVRKILEQQKNITEKQVELCKILSLPKFEIGYHYQGILGQRYQGAHIGLTIPLWENKNVVNASISETFFTDLKLQEHKIEHYFEIKNLYEKYSYLNATLQQYQSIFTTFDHSLLLEKSLELGQITAIEYFMELSYYFAFYDSYLETEFELHLIVAELAKKDL